MEAVLSIFTCNQQQNYAEKVPKRGGVGGERLFLILYNVWLKVIWGRERECVIVNKYIKTHMTLVMA